MILESRFMIAMIVCHTSRAEPSCSPLRLYSHYENHDFSNQNTMLFASNQYSVIFDGELRMHEYKP